MRVIIILFFWTFPFLPFILFLKGGGFMQTLRQDAQAIIDKALADALPDAAVRRALAQFHAPEGRLVLIAAG